MISRRTVMDTAGEVATASGMWRNEQGAAQMTMDSSQVRAQRSASLFQAVLFWGSSGNRVGCL
ncbi:MAG: hypothetical protein NW703_12840 [Nitrospiraceae bacterium]